MPLVVGIGELPWDLLPDGRQMGGAPANFAFHARLGASARSSCRRRRPVGREILEELDRRGLDRAASRSCGGRQGRSRSP
jgi:fructokinase